MIIARNITKALDQPQKCNLTFTIFKYKVLPKKFNFKTALSFQVSQIKLVQPEKTFPGLFERVS